MDWFENIKQDVEELLENETMYSHGYPFREETEEDIANICRYLHEVYGDGYSDYTYDDIYYVCQKFIGKEVI